METVLRLRLLGLLCLSLLMFHRVDSQPRNHNIYPHAQEVEPLTIVPWPYAGQAVYPTGRFIIKPDNKGSLDFDTTLARKFQRAIDSVRIVFGIPGISASVLIPGNGIWLGSTGFSTMNPPDTIRPGSLFGIGSNTKSFISAIMLKLAEEGKLKLDDSIGRYLAPFPNISGKITIRQLMNMTSGLYDYVNDNSAMWDSVYANPDRYWAPESILTAFVGPPHQQPGGPYSYCNTNAILAGMIIRNIEHTDISLQLHQRIFGPFALQETFFPFEDTLTGPVAHPWEDDSDQWPYFGKTNFSLVWTAGSIFSTSENAVRWANALYTGELLAPASLTELLTFVPAKQEFSDRVNQLGYGLFVAENSLLGKTFWGHTGGHIGYLTWITYYPPTGVSVVVLLNVFSSAGLRAMDVALSALYREYFRTLPSFQPALPRTLYAVSGVDETSQLHVVNPTNGAATLVGPTQYGKITSLAAHPGTGILYGLSQTTGLEVVQIDPSTGDALPRSMLPFKSSMVGGMVFTREGELIVSTSDGRLYEVGVNSGDTTLMSKPGIFFRNLAMNPLNGEIWGTHYYNLSLYKVNAATGDTTYKGSTGFNQTTMSLAFDHTGNLFGLLPQSSGMKLIAIDTAAGSGTLVGPLGVSYVYAIAFSPDTTASGVREFVDVQPRQFVLEQNYPNPFNPMTKIQFTIVDRQLTIVNVYDLMGREVATLVNEVKEPGTYTVQFDGSNLASGVYLYRIQAGSLVQTRRLVLLK